MKVRATYLKIQDDDPDEAERELRIAVDNFVRSNIYNFDLQER